MRNERRLSLEFGVAFQLNTSTGWAKTSFKRAHGVRGKPCANVTIEGLVSAKKHEVYYGGMRRMKMR